LQILIANDIACVLFGFELENLIGKNLKDLIKLKPKDQATIGESHLDETSGEMVTISGKVVGIIVYLHVYIIFEEICIGGVMFSVLVSNAVDRGFRAPVRSNQRLSHWYLLLLC
jgi:PAS domain-containing protein